MPSMYEIYDHYATEYNRLVSAEDYQGNLSRHIIGLTDWAGKTVLETGVGTGRITDIYAHYAASITCTDRSTHMLDAASRLLGPYAHKIRFLQADNLSLPRLNPKANLFIEGWSWGHSIVDEPESVSSICTTLLEGALANLTDNAMVIIVETLGTNVTTPTPPHARLAEFYRTLEKTHGFNAEPIRTDYSFKTVEQAAEIMGFFFGSDVEKAITRNGTTVVPEWTGVWSRKGR